MTASTYQVSSRIALLGIALIWMIAETSPTLAHDSWIYEYTCEPPQLTARPARMSGRGYATYMQPATTVGGRGKHK